MNVTLQMIIDNAAIILAVICGLCIMISIITEFTKEIGFLDRIPTNLQVLVLSIVVCVLAFFMFISYMNIQFVWYYLVAVVFIAFIVAIITAKGWDYLIGIVKRFWRRSIDLSEDNK